MSVCERGGGGGCVNELASVITLDCSFVNNMKTRWVATSHMKTAKALLSNSKV